MSVIGPMKKFDPLPIPFQSVPIKSVPIETESGKIGTRLIGIGETRCWYLDAFPYIDDTITAAVHEKKIKEFHKHLNKQNTSIQFTKEIKENGKIPFLDCSNHFTGNQHTLTDYLTKCLTILFHAKVLL